MDNIVLTGVPRSGTTLTCHLLNKLPNVVALHEPIEWTDSADPTTVRQQIDRFYADTRRSLLADGTAHTQQRNGAVPDNPMGDFSRLARLLPSRLRSLPLLRRYGLRSFRVSRSQITVEKPLSADFTLIIKHTGPFTAMLPSLAADYPCFAVVRNPLAVLRSWQTIDFALRDGHMHEAERIAPRLAARLREEDDRIGRQLMLLDWFFAQFATHLTPAQIIRYEEIVETGGAALRSIVPDAAQLAESLSSKNRNPLYNQAEQGDLQSRLLDSDGAYWRFYTKASVRSLSTT